MELSAFFISDSEGGGRRTIEVPHPLTFLEQSTTSLAHDLERLNLRLLHVGSWVFPNIYALGFFFPGQCVSSFHRSIGVSFFSPMGRSKRFFAAFLFFVLPSFFFPRADLSKQRRRYSRLFFTPTANDRGDGKHYHSILIMAGGRGDEQRIYTYPPHTGGIIHFAFSGGRRGHTCMRGCTRGGQLH